MIHVSIIGATGYTGVELVRLLGLRKDVVLDHLTSRTYAGQKIQEVFPHLYGSIDHICEELDLEQVTADSDVIFVALPHGHALPIAKKAKEKGKKVIDLGADFRLKDAAVYEEWYKVAHTEPGLLEEAVYGLPEWNREAIKDADIIANPGCFVTSILLGLMPLMKKGLGGAGFRYLRFQVGDIRSRPQRKSGQSLHGSGEQLQGLRRCAPPPHSGNRTAFDGDVGDGNADPIHTAFGADEPWHSEHDLRGRNRWPLRRSHPRHL